VPITRTQPSKTSRQHKNSPYDFFSFTIRRTDDLDDADDFRAIRFHVTAELAGRIFDEFVVDVGFVDSIATTPDTIQTSDLLSFADIEPVRVPALPLPQHVAEKVHACTRTYGEAARPSTRPKDLVDILLIAHAEHVDAAQLRNALETTFGERAQQPLRSELPPPPQAGASRTSAWRQRSTSSPTSTKPGTRPAPSSIPSSPARQPGSGIHNGAPGSSFDRRLL
jgi:hypothetical protein